MKVLEGPIGTDFMIPSAVPAWCRCPGMMQALVIFYSTAGPIESLDDMKGLKIRVQDLN